MKKKPPAARKDDQTTMTISLPKSLKKQIIARAKQEKRTTSNFLVKELSERLPDDPKESAKFVS